MDRSNTQSLLDDLVERPCMQKMKGRDSNERITVTSIFVHVNQVRVSSIRHPMFTGNRQTKKRWAQTGG